MKTEFKISIRSLVEFIMRRGNIDNRYVGSTKAVEGIRGHQRIQKSYGENYEADVPLKHTVSYDDMNIIVEGREDGILKEDDKIIIDEIKTTTKELLMIDENFNPLHFAQAKCYGYIYCSDNNLDSIYIQLTYYNIETKNTRVIRNQYSFKDLEKFFLELVEEYRIWCAIECSFIEERNKSIKNLEFPFETYRKGQRDLAVRVYKSIENSNNCYAQAPTGIGKTISTLFPSIKAMGEGITSKIFYLTAKTITREIAENTIEFMKKKGLNIKSVTITAKEKICNMNEVNCNPEYCPYARGYYDKINDALKEIIKKYASYSRVNIKKISQEYMICPFELSLELTLLSDIIVCDYNYVFDKSVYLKRFFDVKNTDFTFLIDESHNLVPRGRSMYSASIFEEKVSNIKKLYVKKDIRLNKAINEISTYFRGKSVELSGIGERTVVEEDAPMDLYDLLTLFLRIVEEYLSNSRDDNDELLDLYFDIYFFVSILDDYDNNYVTIYKESNEGIMIKLYCVDPSKNLQERMNKAKANIIFSATLLPMEYFEKMYGFKNGDHKVNLRSPFNTKNRLIMIGDNVITTYKKREDTSLEIIKYITSVVEAKKGNYIVFFPSYKYMNMVYEKMEGRYSSIELVLQGKDMSEEGKEEFLEKFKENNEKTHVGFCVLGGHFSEGIDLTYDKLIGVIIVGVGMPQIGIDRDIIKDHLNEDNNGFNYAYIYPGIIKVLQAAGRCIRTEKDRGIIMLLDSRYSKKEYKSLLPSDWFPISIVKNSEDVSLACSEFWKDKV